MPRFSVKAWCRAVTVLGGVLAVVALLALIISVVSNVPGNPAAAASATAPTAFLILAVMMIGGVGLMLVSAIIQRSHGHRLRLWMLGLDALFQSFAGRDKRRNANLEPDRSAEDSPKGPEGDGHGRVTVTAPTAPPAGGAVRGSPTPPPPEPREPYRPKFVPLWNNVISYFGLFLTAMAILLLLTFALFTVVTRQANPYVDIVGYLVLPGILVLGSLIVPVGMFFKSWRLRRRDPSQKLSFLFPRIDLNDPAQLRAAKVVVGGTFLMLPVVVVSSYHGYHYSDSAEFCAKACHKVMEPQATTYEHSAHARVACAECHIGEGASWFVKSKLSGTRQVFATIQESFPRPIPPAITNLRPARETCERCHWPKKFFGAQLREIVHFGADENNTRRELDMLLKTGGGDESIGRAEGIHMHMALEGRLEYVATDVKVQDIPWVKYTDRAGNVWIYRSDGRPSSDPIPEGPVRQLDCMDCHNRPAHNFRSPEEAVDIFLDVGRIDTTLPFIKREA
ncbi:MAG: NapC/NirT family cytochrome c, partial [Planctomycetota bacterium]